MTEKPIRLVLADVDGTLVTQEKVLTDQAIAAVRSLHEAGILFAVTSGRPPRGMSMLVEPLRLSTPMAAFNGGLIVDQDMKVIDQKVVPDSLVKPTIDLMEKSGLAAWLYRGQDWYVLDVKGPHVKREADTVLFQPTVVDTYEGLEDHVAKIVGVTDDKDAIDEATEAVRQQFGDRVSAAQSQPYYLDVTHPDANKGTVAQFLSKTYDIPPAQIATIGDMPNDVLMFAHSGLSIAMGNASAEVQQAARKVTASNQDEGFAQAMHRFVLNQE